MRQKERASLEWLGGRELQDEVEEIGGGGGKMGTRREREIEKRKREREAME